MHTTGLTSVLELVSSSGGIFPFHQGKAYAGSQCGAGKKQGGAPKQIVSTTARNVLPNPLSGPASHEQQATHNHPDASSWRRLWSGKPGSQISREHSLRLGAEYLPKASPAARRSKANKEARLVEGKVCFIPKASNREGRAVSCPKTDSPH